MRIAVVGASDSWYLRDLQRAAATRHELVAVPFSRLSHSLGGAAILGADAFDAVLVRSMPPGSLEQVVFRMDLLARWEAAGTVVLNPPRAIETAVDKFLASAKLEAAGLRIPRTIACQTSDEALAAFAALGGDVVVKPLFGSEGRGIARLQDEALALRAFRMLEQLGAVLYVQEFIPHEGADYRLLVVGARVLGMRRRNPHDWRTNVSRGAVAEPLEVTPALAEMARRAAAAVGAPLAGVDLLPGRDGVLYAIEVNAVPGWRALNRATGCDVAGFVLDDLATRAESRR
ncbi:MAG TPA: RimK family alpha-L-glutamate ligase [Pirellulales bacterium]|nr:RimK family alpha-L-glutamate ligase [Pirellulales bacterium]